MSERNEGEVVTFYSFKGGTGRTMALVNVGVLLAAPKSSPVVLVDWDLEAPGLLHFFKSRIPGKTDSEAKDHPGVVDYFQKIADLPKDIDREDETSPDLDLEPYIQTTTIQGLSLISAGRRDSDYVDRLRAIDWHKIYQSRPHAFARFARGLASRFLYVLIDSRTGMTDISSICTSILPSKLVVVFSPNSQSLDGLPDLIPQIVNYRRESDDARPLVVYPLPSKIDRSEADLLRIWRSGDPDLQVVGYQRMFEEVFKQAYGLDECSLETYFNEIEVQYVPRYSYGEDIAALEETVKQRLSLATSYNAIANRLIGTLSPWQSRSEESPALLVGVPSGVMAQSARPSMRFLSRGAERVAKEVVDRSDLPRVREGVRQARAFFDSTWPEKIRAHGRRQEPESVPRDKIYDSCLPVIADFERDVLRLEEFWLRVVDADYSDACIALCRVLEDWLSFTGARWEDSSLKAARGAPSLMALRFLLGGVARAIDNWSAKTVGLLLGQPLQANDMFDGVQTLSLVDRRDLFYPPAFLEYADLGARYLADLFPKSRGIERLFISEKQYRENLAVAYFLVTMINLARHPSESEPLFPGFKLIEDSSTSVLGFVQRLKRSPEMIGSLSGVVGESPADFRTAWARRMAVINEATLGPRYFTLWRAVHENL